MDERISLRFQGKLLSLRMEDANLANIDRVSKAKGQSRSEWMRLALLTQLVVDLAEIGAPAPVEKMFPVPHPEDDTEALNEIVQGASEMVGAWAPPEPEPEVEDLRINKWA